MASLALAGLAGCALRSEARPGADAPETRPPRIVVAVPPARNLSNSGNWDPVRVADELSAALMEVPGIEVIPVNRTLGALHVLGLDELESADDAYALMEQTGADAAMVAAVTEFNPYDPPRVALTVQWYDGVRPEPVGAVDPVALSRASTTVAPRPAERRPIAQVQRVYDAADQKLLADLRDFALRRDGRDSPYGWRAHAKSTALFIRYISCSVVETILQQAVEIRDVEPTREASHD